MKTFEHGEDVSPLDDEYECPNCYDMIRARDITSDEEDATDSNHLEGECPHCGALCCFTCGHVY